MSSSNASGAGGAAPGQRDGQQRDNNTQASKHAQFCRKVGIKRKPIIFGPDHDPERTDRQDHTLGPLEAVEGGYYAEVLSAYNWHTFQYWLTATVVDSLYLLQISIGATATAISAAKVPTITVTILTAIGTVVAGVLAFLKSRGQPNRARQFRNDLRKVCDYIRFMEMEFSDPPCDTSVEQALQEVRRLYDAARTNAETNYPDTWSVLPVQRQAGNKPTIGARDIENDESVRGG